MSRESELRKRLAALDQRKEAQTRWGRTEALSRDLGLVGARERAEVEAFCEIRLFLPWRGLKDLRSELESEGFFFANHTSKMLLASFPEGWKLVPASLTKATCAMAYLVDPSGCYRAVISFRVGNNDIRANICRYDS